MINSFILRLIYTLVNVNNNIFKVSFTNKQNRSASASTYKNEESFYLMLLKN